MGVPPVIIHFRLGFSLTKTIHLEVPPFMETRTYIYIYTRTVGKTLPVITIHHQSSPSSQVGFGKNPIPSQTVVVTMKHRCESALL